MNARMALRLAFLKRSSTAPVVRPANTFPVLCDRDPDRQPLIPKRYQELATQLFAGALLLFLILACAMLGGLK